MGSSSVTFESCGGGSSRALEDVGEVDGDAVTMSPLPLPMSTLGVGESVGEAVGEAEEEALGDGEGEVVGEADGDAVTMSPLSLPTSSLPLPMSTLGVAESVGVAVGEAVGEAVGDIK